MPTHTSHEDAQGNDGRCAKSAGEDADKDTHDTAEDCAQCPTGQLTFGQDGRPFCQPCPAGSRSALNETTGAVEACIPCVPGYFQQAAGNTTCAACGEGQHQNNFGKPYCLPCIPGTFTDRTGQEACVACGRNTFSAEPQAMY